MAVVLGKRKRIVAETKPAREQSPSPSENSVDDEDIKEVFRRHFEAQFKPIAAEPKKVIAQVEDEPSASEQEEESDWDGLESEDDTGVEVIEHTVSRPTSDRLTKEEFKAFMSSKLPMSAMPKVKKQPKSSKTDDQEDDEALNVKNDVALQRLLSESHLLSNSGDTSLTLTGSNRHKATDMRLQAMGSKKSILTQAKMPMSHRKGILAKAASREEKRRKEAKENGIILERAVKMRKDGERKRERGVGGPSVGKFRGGELKLSRRDIASIEGPKDRGRGGKRGRR